MNTKGIARKDVETPVGLNVGSMREGVHPRHDEESAEVIDKQRVGERPLRK
jgi:hypothetical protein